MFVKDGQLAFVYNFLGIPPEQKLTCPAPTCGKHVIGVEFKKTLISEKSEALGTMTLYVDHKAAGSNNFRTQSGHYALAGEGLAIGYDSGNRVSTEYSSTFDFSGANQLSFFAVRRN
jgi:arylsulfatase